MGFSRSRWRTTNFRTLPLAVRGKSSAWWSSSGHFCRATPAASKCARTDSCPVEVDAVPARYVASEESALVQWISKRIMRTSLDTTMEATMVLTSNASPILQHSDDAKEARKAFTEKRKPQFKGG